jgi:hypothetical protein
VLATNIILLIFDRNLKMPRVHVSTSLPRTGLSSTSFIWCGNDHDDDDEPLVGIVASGSTSPKSHCPTLGSSHS